MSAQNATGFTVSFPSHRADRRVIVDDDGRTGYAYISDTRKWVADVWLYNRAPAPEEPEWNFRPPDPPFLNPRRLCQDELQFPLPSSDDAVEVRAFDHRRGFGAFIFIHGCLAGLVFDHCKPGWAAMAKATGPLARSFLSLLPAQGKPDPTALWSYLVDAARPASGLPSEENSNVRPSDIELAWVADLLADAH